MFFLWVDHATLFFLWVDPATLFFFILSNWMWVHVTLWLLFVIMTSCDTVWHPVSHVTMFWHVTSCCHVTPCLHIILCGVLSTCDTMWFCAILFCYIWHLISVLLAVMCDFLSCGSVWYCTAASYITSVSYSLLCVISFHVALCDIVLLHLTPHLCLTRYDVWLPFMWLCMILCCYIWHHICVLLTMMCDFLSCGSVWYCIATSDTTSLSYSI